MVPSLPTVDARNCGLANAEFPGDGCASAPSSKSGTNHADAILGELRGPRSFTASRTPTNLAILNVVDVRTALKVRRVNARRVIATVADAGSMIAGAFRKSAIRDDPHEAIGFFGATVKLKDAVALTVASAEPRPAFVRPAYVNLAPETNNRCGTCIVPFRHRKPVLSLLRGRRGTKNPVRPRYCSALAA